VEEEFEPSIPRLEVLETTRSPMFVVVHFFPLYKPNSRGRYCSLFIAVYGGLVYLLV
jgi:hypothetical protein